MSPVFFLEDMVGLYFHSMLETIYIDFGETIIDLQTIQPASTFAQSISSASSEFHRDCVLT